MSAEPSNPPAARLAGPGVTTALVSTASREPAGRDAEYIAWHSLDHVPELYRVPEVRGHQRLVSTPACRAARGPQAPAYERVDHVMIYLLTAAAGLGTLAAVATALASAGRTAEVALPAVSLGVFGLVETTAAAPTSTGAEVLAWRPAVGGYVLIERGEQPADALEDVAGVAGVWRFTGVDARSYFPTDSSGLQITWCFLDDDPAEVGARLAPVVAQRAASPGVEVLLAAPFHTVRPPEWDRFVP
jgi:hypothetical protein